jgi:hypothetical protein
MCRVKTRVIAVAMILAILLAVLSPTRALAQAKKEITPAQVEAAIKLSVGYLRSKQDKNRGAWFYAGNEAGLTALVTLALLSAGVPANDPAVEKALRYLSDRGDIGITYDTSLQTMAFCAANPERFRAQIRRNVTWLQNAQLARGTWTYHSGNGGAGAGDNSNTQFALLALHEAQRSGVEVNPLVWKRAMAFWLDSQNMDGGFGYMPGLASTGSMTCAGITSLVIASGKLTDGDAKVKNGKVLCCGEQMSDLPLERAIAWMGGNFSVLRNPSNNFLLGQGNWMYYMYGLERAGRLTGRRYFGDHDWYREGAEVLVAKQFDDGTWECENGGEVGAALGLLFLAKGQRPILVSKYQYAETASDWDPHRSGIPHLTRYVEQVWKRDLAWQVIQAKSARTEDLLESPVLFISGRNNLFLTPEQKISLKAYVEQGGFLFVEKACGGEAFDAAFRSLMKELFPESQLQALRPDHPVWYAEEKVNAKFVQPVLEGIDACCRTSVVYSTRDLSCYWELDYDDRQQQRAYPEEVQEEIVACRAIGLNILSYATGRQLKNKLEKPVIMFKKGGDNIARETLAMTKLAHTGGADDAPNALGNLLGYLSAETEMRTRSDAGMISPADLKLADYSIVFVHGRKAFEWSAAERKALRTYVERGGIVVADAICGNVQFAESFRREWETIFPEARFTRLPKEHALFSKDFEGFDISKVSYRRPMEGARSELTQGAPQLEAMEWEGRLAVIFSPLDLSCALENSKSPDCIGYVKDDAIRIGINVLLYCLQQ